MLNISLELKTTFENLQNELTKNVFPNIEVPESARMLNEVWFSDMLAWLLDPNGTHPFGVNFAKELMKTIASLRHSKSHNYKTGNKFLNKYKGSKGQSAYGYKLRNATSVREFYLSQLKDTRKKSNEYKFCDVVFFDLDRDDGFILFIENKLFTFNREGQLNTYLSIIKEKFNNIKVVEYVYLTLNGSEPKIYNKKDDCKTNKYWIPVSWTDEILSILTKLDNKEDTKVIELINTLKWLKELINNLEKFDVSELVNEINKTVLKTISSYFHYQLIRLSEGKRGIWKIKENKKSTIFTHSSSSTKKLIMTLNSNYSITIEIEQNKKTNTKVNKKKMEKFIIPFGIPFDQILNIIDIEVGNIYSYYFNDSSLYKNNYRRRKERPEIKSELKELPETLNFIYKNKFNIQAILSLSKILAPNNNNKC